MSKLIPPPHLRKSRLKGVRTRTIERTLANTAGVERERVNLATNTATIEYQPSRIQVADFIAAIEDLG